jgi:hypothetical protein
MNNMTTKTGSLDTDNRANNHPAKPDAFVLSEHKQAGTRAKTDHPAAPSGQPGAENMSQPFQQREDWVLFRNLATLGQKAGVPVERLPRLVARELVDNALDAGGACHFGKLEGGFFVDDNGPGLPGTDEEIAALFSVRRPMMTSKLIRLPTRGALGNGLRVVAGAVLASGGRLVVSTRGRTIYLQPQEDGSTLVVGVEPYEESDGTRVEVYFGQGLADNDLFLFSWCERAQELSNKGKLFKGRTSPHWYDSDSFWELLQAWEGLTVGQIIAQLQDCSKKAEKIAGKNVNRHARQLTRQEAEVILMAAREESEPVAPSRLGCVGKMSRYPGYYLVDGVFEMRPARGNVGAEIPFVVEVWARRSDRMSAAVCINRTPVAARVSVERQGDNKNNCAIFGCNLGYDFRVGKGNYELLINVICPFMPITTDGKEPDLGPLWEEISEAIEKAVNRAKRNSSATEGQKLPSQKEVIIKAIPEAIKKVSGEGKHRYSLRQLFYAIRPFFLKVFDKEPSYDTFADVIGEYEAERGQDLPGIYRDTRGLLYHPHTGEVIPLGTLAVEKYKRPAWTFNKVLYCEKEGFFPVLIDAKWPERNDCALLTSKGFASRAARDLLDLLGETDEPITFFCVHDADGSGTMIYQALQEGTRARPGRRISVVNLGLEPREGREMGLPVESVERKNGRAVPVANYAEAERKWLQQNRIELNAMTTAEFIEWLDRKMSPFLRDGVAVKVIPPAAVMVDRLAGDVKSKVREKIVADVLQAAGVDWKVEAAFTALGPALQSQSALLMSHVGEALSAMPEVPWTVPVARVAEEIAAGLAG